MLLRLICTFAGSAFAAFCIATRAYAAGALVVGAQLEPPNLDPTSGAAAAIDEVVYANVFEGLTRIREDGSVAPGLATKWSVSDNARVYDFFLREKVLFHDGEPFDARDVVFTLNRARAPDSTNAQRPLFEIIQSVEALAAHHVRITLKEPVGALPTYLGWGDAVIVSSKSAATNAIAPVGTGPFRFERWRKGASVTLVRNDAYWGSAAALDRIVFTFIPDPSAAFAALMAGDVDGFPNYPAAENLDLVRRDSRFRIDFGSSEGEMLVAINNGKAPFDDVRVRQALNHAVDKSAVIEAALFGYGEPIGSHFPPHHPAYIDLSDKYPHDPDRARALLAEAGFPNGFETNLALPPPAYARRAGEVVAAQLQAVGVKVRIRHLEWAQWLEQVFANKAYDLTIVSHTEPLDIDIYARDDYYFQYHNDTFDEVIAAIAQEPDPQGRNTLYRQAQTLLADDAVNIFLAASPKISVWRKETKGVWKNAPVQANDFTRANVTGRATLNDREQARRAFPAPAVLVSLITGAVALLMFHVKANPAYLLERAISMTLSLLAASIVIFLLLEIAPGDPAAFMMGLNADPASVESVRAELGLNRPALQRYTSWVGGIFTGDLGTSYTYRTPVSELIAERIFVSLPLALMAFAFSTAIGLPAGLLAAARAETPSGRAILTGAQAGVAVPNFWLGILLVLVFAVFLRWFSAGGFPGWDAGVGPALKALLLPAIALALPQAAILTQIMRSATLDALNDDYIRTARAKGLSFNEALRKHAFRNALVPTLTILGLQFSFLLAGGVIIENVFYLPGLGRLVFQSIAQRDLIVVKSVVMILVLTVILVAFIVDLAYAAADPRLRQRDAQ
ncbi:MAG: ABC transporter substrate-binding protein [Hyphococcus sp.]